MKAGVRAVGVAESYTDRYSTLAAAIVTADRTVDGFGFGTCTVGGLDATDRVCSLLERTLREDVQYVLLAGIALAWYNLLDLPAIRAVAERPVCAVSFESSAGLEAPIEDAFDGADRIERLEIYRRQPERVRVPLNDDSLYLRALGFEEDEPADVIRGFTPAGGRPEPLRVARLAARAADCWRTDS